MTTPTLPDAARMALDALESLQGGCTDSGDGTVEAITVWCPEVIAALRAALSAAPSAPFDVEAMLTACVPGGDYCDPQHVADAIRAYCAAPAAAVGDVQPVAPFLFIAMDDDKRAHLTWCANEAEVHAAVSLAMFWLHPGENLNPDHAEELAASAAELLDSGALTFEGDAPLYLYRVAGAPTVAQQAAPLRDVPAGEQWQLWGCAQETGTDCLLRYGTEAEARAELARAAKKGYDLWAISPDGAKHLPGSAPVAQQAAEPTEAQIALLDPWMRPAAARELLRQVLAVAPAAHAQQQAAPLGECDECGTPYLPDPTDGGSICVRCVRETLGRLHAQQQAATVQPLTQAANAALAEVEKATRKFPTWPTDPLHALAVLGEEFGELTKDVLQMVYEPHKTTRDRIRTECVQTAAMALRFMASLDRYEYRPGEQHSQGGITATQQAPTGAAWVDANVSGPEPLMQAMRNHATQQAPTDTDTAKD